MARIRRVTSELEVYPGWGTDLKVLPLLRQCFTYGPGEDRATGYLYDGGDSGQEWPRPLSWAGPLMLGRLAKLPGVKFPVVAFQAYRDGSGCDWHADTPFGAQAILSLGVTRTFAIRSRDRVEEFRLAHGDLVFMPDGFQDEWEHRVPVEDTPGERCSLVFRTRGA
jgi:alkylated DNA repair dioxygenase AlkB